MLETQQELDVMQLASYLSQAENALDKATELYKIALPNGTRFYQIDLDEITKYVRQAKNAIRRELSGCPSCGLVEGCHTSDCPHDRPDPTYSAASAVIA